MRSVVKHLAICLGPWLVSGPCHADVLYRYGKGVLFDGRYGPIAKAQDKLNDALHACGKAAPVTVDGHFGQKMREALKELAGCPAIAPNVKNDADAQAGQLTGIYWDILVGGAAPSVDDRARTIMLTYEATDYTSLEWNFCQSKPIYNPAAGQNHCYSNDPHSYLTWGPNGATGGGGREAQLILGAVDAQDPARIDRSFGAEAKSVRRMFQMPDKDHPRSLETYLCGIWADPHRRDAWKAGFGSIGKETIVRTKYDELYRSTSLDGGKIDVFMRAYKVNNLKITEIDYGFFKDRAAHTTPHFDPIKGAIADVLQKHPGAEPWQVRQAIALAVRPSGSQREDRLGRDVAFYIDGAGTHLSAEERDAWTHRGQIMASDAGLSDARPYTAFVPGPPLDTNIAHPEKLTEDERARCPQAVLDTQFPPRP